MIDGDPGDPGGSLSQSSGDDTAGGGVRGGLLFPGRGRAETPEDNFDRSPLVCFRAPEQTVRICETFSGLLGLFLQASKVP